MQCYNLYLLKKGWLTTFHMATTLIVLGFTSNLISAQTWDQNLKVIASDRNSGDYFGNSIASSGDYVFIGARLEDHDQNGNDSVSNAGSVYVLKNIAGNWTQTQKIVASNRKVDDTFGHAIAMSGDFAMISAINVDFDTSGYDSIRSSGMVYVFKNIKGKWTQVQKLVAGDRGVDDVFGFSIAMTNEYAIITAVSDDKDVNGGNKISNTGSAYVFKNNSGVWSQTQKIVASDRRYWGAFGNSVDISDELAIIGAYFSEAAYIFKNDSGTWSEVQKIVASDGGYPDRFGFSVAISNNYTIVGAYGDSHDINGRDSIFNSGSAYIYRNDSGSWKQVQKLVASDRGKYFHFGNSVDLNSDYALVGSIWDSKDSIGQNMMQDAGATYLFKLDSGKWSINQKLTADDRDEGDYFGHAVTLTKNVIIIGAIREDNDLKGGDSLRNPGAVYFFKKRCIPIETIDAHTACDSFIWLDNKTYTVSNSDANIKLINRQGCDSIITLNLKINSSSYSIDVQEACDSFIWHDGNTYFSSTDSPQYVMTNAFGCDSVIILDLTLNKVTDLSTTVSGDTIFANNKNAAFQWLDCKDGNAIIKGENSQSFTPDINGSYSVELTENGCIDTSICVDMTTVSVVENSFNFDIELYPNPTNGNLTIDLGSAHENTLIQVSDIYGKLLATKRTRSSRFVDVSFYGPAGTYIITIQTGHKKAVMHVIKQ